MTTATRLDRTNIHPALRQPAVASLCCMPIRILVPVNPNHQTSPKTCMLPGNPFPQAYPCFGASDARSQGN